VCEQVCARAETHAQTHAHAHANTYAHLHRHGHACSFSLALTHLGSWPHMAAWWDVCGREFDSVSRRCSWARDHAHVL
jgi:hypothetical protein